MTKIITPAGNAHRDTSAATARLRSELAQTMSYRALEQRVAFDAAGAVTLDNVADAVPTVTAANDTIALVPALTVETTRAIVAVLETSSPHERSIVVFIDSAVTDPALIAAAAPANAEIILLESGRDGVDQIAQHLQGRKDIEAIHIVSHGQAGVLHLGTTELTTTSMAGVHADDVAVIRAALSRDADILVYGCDIAAGPEGHAFAAALAAATGADVAASDDATGAASRGGNWDLEVRQGLIEAGLINAPEWNGELAPLTINVSGLPTITGATGVSVATGFATGGVGFTGLWTNAGTIGGTAIDIRATVTSATLGTAVSFHTAFGANLYGPGRDADDMWVAVNGGTASIQWEIFASGTNQTIIAQGDPNFRIADLDGNASVVTPFPANEVESIAPSLTSLTSYTVSSPTNLLTGISGGNLTVVGTTSQNAEANSLVGFDWKDVSTWQVTYAAQAGWGDRFFFHDGDGDFTFISPVTTTLLSLDLDADNTAATGTAYQATFTENGAGIPIVDADVTISQHAALGADLGRANVVLTNAQTGDVLTVGTLPPGITATVDTSVPGQITVTLSGADTVANYQAALAAIRFANLSDAPSTVDRNITVDVENASFKTTSATAISTIHVSVINDAPAGTDQTLTTPEDTAVTLTVADFGFVDVDGNVLLDVTIASLPTNGVLSYNGIALTAAQIASGYAVSAADIAAGKLLWTPTANANGTAYASFTFQVRDDGGTTNGGVDLDQSLNTITFDVTQLNDAPVDGDEMSDVREDTTLTVSVATGLLANLTDIDGGTPAVTGFTIAGQVGPFAVGTPYAIASVGTVSVNADGSYSFTPTLNYSGLVPVITYTVSDGNGGADTSTLTLAITPVNDAPTAVNDLGAGAVGLPIVVDVLGNDADVDNALVPASVQITGTANPGENLVAAGQGTWSVNSITGAITFTPLSGYLGVPTPISYTVADAAGDRSGAATVAVMPILSSPHLDLSGATPRTGAYLYGHNNTGFTASWASPAGLARFDHVDPAVGGPGLSYTNDNSSGYVTGVASATLAQSIAQNEYISMTFETLASIPETWLTETGKRIAGGNFQFAFAISNDGFASATLLSKDNLPSTGPVYDGNPSYVTAVAADYQLQPGTDYEVRVYFYNVSGGTTTSFTWDDIYTSYSNDPTSYETTFTEGQSAVAIAAASIQIEDANSASLSAGTVTFTNLQADDRLRVSGSIVANGSTGSIGAITYTVTESAGVVTIELTGSATQAAYAAALAAITYENTSETPATVDRIVNVTVTDGIETSNLATTTIHVVPVNDVPVAEPDAGSVSEDAPLISGNVISAAPGQDTDADGDTIVVATAHQGATPITLGTPFMVAGGGMLTLHADGRYTFEPGTAYNGLDVAETATETISYSVSDGNGGTATALLVITINGANDVPVIIDPANPGTPDNPLPATDPLNIIPDVATTDGAPLTPINVGRFIADPDGEPLTFALHPSAPAWVMIDPATGIITGTPPADASQVSNTGTPGAYLLTITATDPDGTTVTTTVTLNIINLPPVAQDDAGEIGEDAVSVTGNVITGAGTDTDTAPDSDPLNVTTAHQGATPITLGTPFMVAGGGMLTLHVDGRYTFEPGTAYNGLDVAETATETVSYSVSDGNGGTATALLVITINGANDVPVIIDPANPGTPDNPLPATDPLNIIPDVATTDGAPLTPINVGRFIADPDGEPLTFALDPSAPTWVMIDPATGIITGTPPADASQVSNTGTPGAYLLTITATDPDGTTVTTTVTLNIVNLPPVARDDSGDVDELGTPITLTVLSNDADGDSDRDALRVIAATAQHGTVVVNHNGTLTYTPNAGYDGPEIVSYWISDGNGGKATAVVRIDVAAAPHVAAADRAVVFPEPPLGPQPDALNTDPIVLDTVETLKQLGRDGLGSTSATASAGDVHGLTGFSLKLAGSQSDSATKIEAFVRNRTLIVQLDLLGHALRNTAVEWQVQRSDGRPMPDWLGFVGRDVLMGERAAHEEIIDIRISAIRRDGTVVTNEVRINTVTGEIQPLKVGRSGALTPPLFWNQIQAETPLSDDQLHRLGARLSVMER